MRFVKILAVATAALATAPANAQYYAGKTIEFIVGTGPGGGYDTYARVVARHMPKYIAGTPTIAVKNLPGAGSAKAAAMIASVSPKDGTSVGIVFPGVIIGPVLDPGMTKLFEPSKFIYIGSADSGTRVCVTYATSKIKTLADAQKMKTVLGASAAGGSTRDYAHMLNHTTGTQFQVVNGYKGTADIFLAVERGEVDGLCGLDWSSLKAQRGSWIAEKKLNIIVQTAIETEPALNELKVPHIHQLIKNEADRKAADLVMSQQVFGRPFILPPGTNPEAVKILREAFLKALADPALLAEAAKMRIDINPIDGERVQKLVESLYVMPQDVVERARKISLQ